MNKYQEALNILKENAYEYTEDTLDGEEWFLDYEPMDNVDEIAKPLQELVDKATSKKPLGISLTHEGKVGNCPYCHKFVREVDMTICECGQKLDWSDCEL